MRTLNKIPVRGGKVKKSSQGPVVVTYSGQSMTAGYVHRCKVFVHLPYVKEVVEVARWSRSRLTLRSSLPLLPEKFHRLANTCISVIFFSSVMTLFMLAIPSSYLLAGRCLCTVPKQNSSYSLRLGFLPHTLQIKVKDVGFKRGKKIKELCLLIKLMKIRKGKSTSSLLSVFSIVYELHPPDSSLWWCSSPCKHAKSAKTGHCSTDMNHRLSDGVKHLYCASLASLQGGQCIL